MRFGASRDSDRAKMVDRFHPHKQTLEVFPVVATAFGVCEIHTIKAEDGTVRCPFVGVEVGVID